MSKETCTTFAATSSSPWPSPTNYLMRTWLAPTTCSGLYPTFGVPPLRISWKLSVNMLKEVWAHGWLICIWSLTGFAPSATTSGKSWKNWVRPGSTPPFSLPCAALGTKALSWFWMTRCDLWPGHGACLSYCRQLCWVRRRRRKAFSLPPNRASWILASAAWTWLSPSARRCPLWSCRMPMPARRMLGDQSASIPLTYLYTFTVCTSILQYIQNIYIYTYAVQYIEYRVHTIYIYTPISIVYIYTSIHRYIFTSLHTYTYTVHLCTHTLIYTYIQTQIYTYITYIDIYTYICVALLASLGPRLGYWSEHISQMFWRNSCILPCFGQGRQGNDWWLSSVTTRWFWSSEQVSHPGSEQCIECNADEILGRQAGFKLMAFSTFSTAVSILSSGN